MEIYVHTNTCTQMFTAALLIIAEKWKPFKGPSNNKWVNKVWYMHIIDYYSAY